MLKIILILILMSTNSYAYDIGTAMYWSNQAKDQQLDQQYKQQKIEEQRLKNEKLRRDLKIERDTPNYNYVPPPPIPPR